MTEIEKMYENAGVSKQEYRHNNLVYKKEVKYPPFTAAKQIELIKKIGNINIDIDNGCYMSSEILEVEAHCDELEETLAEFVNNLWQDLTDQEKEEIRGILNE